MINLMPPELKQEIIFARRNTLLLHWAIGALIIIGGLFAVISAGRYYVQQSIGLITQDIAQAQANLQSQSLTEAEQRVEEISTQTKLAVQVLSRQLLFSKLLRQIGTVMPEGTALTSLDVSQISGGIDLDATALNTNAATQIQINLQDPANKIFEKADINSIDCTGGGGRLYPCDVSLRALFGDNRQFYFLTEGEAQP